MSKKKISREDTTLDSNKSDLVSVGESYHRKLKTGKDTNTNEDHDGIALKNSQTPNCRLYDENELCAGESFWCFACTVRKKYLEA